MKVAMTPTRFLERSARLYADKTAVVCGAERLTYRAFAERVQRLSQVLLDLGVGKGDRVAYLGLNCHRLLELYYAVLPVGAVLTPVNIRLHPQEIAFILNDLEASVLFSDQTLRPMAEALRTQVPSLRALVSTSPGSAPPPWLDYEELLAKAQAAPSAVAVDEDDVAEIFYTSGTTGRPKGVMLTHRNLYTHALQVIVAVGLREDTVELVGNVPLFHVNAWGSPQYLVALGATAVVTPRFDPAAFCALVERERASFALLVPTMLNDLIHYEGLSRHDLSSLRLILIGGAPPPPTLIAAASGRLGCEVRVGYGLTETCPVIALTYLKEHKRAGWDEAERQRRLAMTGLPLVGVDIRVVDEAGREVPWDGHTMGEIEVRGDVVFLGYWRRPEETAAAFREGYFRTGDMATVDAEGYLQILDRKKDIIISGGENMSSVEIEEALYTHPGVRECAVVGRPHERWGEVPHAFVVPAEGQQVTREDLLAHVRGRLAAFKVPRDVTFVESLPKTGTGKVQKEQLRSLLREQEGS